MLFNTNSRISEIVFKRRYDAWTKFQESAQKNVRGINFRREKVKIDKHVKDPIGEAMRICQLICDDRTRCCMACIKPSSYGFKAGESGFYCYLYDAKFGGRSEQFIEAVSMMSRNDEYCSYKNENHDDGDKCKAEPSAIDKIPYFSQFV